MIEAVIAGLIQGFLEWLPVSSSGQATLALISFFGVSPEDAYRFSLMLHGGTALSAIMWYRRDVRNMISNPRDPLSLFVILSYIASLIVAYPLYGVAEDMAAQDKLTLAIGVAFIATGLILYSSQKGSVTVKNRRELRLGDGVLMGIAQGVAVIPGLSRSALTIATLLARGYEPGRAVKLSFISSIPATLTAGVYEFLTSTTWAQTSIQSSVLALSLAFASGLAGIALMEKLAAKLRFDYFLIAIGGIVILLTAPFA